MRRFAQSFADVDTFAPGLPDHLTLARTDALEVHYVSKAVRDLKQDEYRLLEPVSPDELHADEFVAWDGDGLDEDEG